MVAGLVLILQTTGPVTAQDAPSGNTNTDESEQQSEEQTEETPRSEAYQLLEEAVSNSGEQEGYHLETVIRFDTPDYSETMTTRSRGTFREGGAFTLRSETPQGMTVESYGAFGEIAHIDPSSHAIVTSEELGLSTVNKTMLDPFQQLDLLLQPDYEGFSIREREPVEEKGRRLRLIEVRPGTGQIKAVHERYSEEMEEEINMEETRIVYSIFIRPESRLLEKISFDIRSKLKRPSPADRDGSEDSDFIDDLMEDEEEGESEPDGDQEESEPRDQDDGGSDFEEDLEEEVEGEQEEDSGANSVRIRGTFQFKKYNSDLDFEIADDIYEKLRQWAGKKEAE